MKLTILILVILLLFLSYRLAEDFVRRSLSSLSHAERVWIELSLAARSLVEAEIPTSVRRVVLALMMSAGCGCYVRGMLVSHYLPRNFLNFSGGAKNVNRGWDQAFFDASALPANLSEDFSKFIALVMVYDSYRNPLQGYLFRRLIRSITRPDLDYGTRAEVELTAFSVVSNRKPREFVPALA